MSTLKRFACSYSYCCYTFLFLGREPTLYSQACSGYLLLSYLYLDVCIRTCGPTTRCAVLNRVLVESVLKYIPYQQLKYIEWIAELRPTYLYYGVLHLIERLVTCIFIFCS